MVCWFVYKARGHQNIDDLGVARSEGRECDGTVVGTLSINAVRKSENDVAPDSCWEDVTTSCGLRILAEPR